MANQPAPARPSFTLPREKRPVAALGNGAQVAPPVVAPPPPPPAPAPVAAPAVAYEPRDPVFFLLAVCSFAAALQPPGSVHDADRDQAEKTGAICARVLDGGPVPEKLVLPRHRRTLEVVKSKEDLAARVDGAPVARVMTESEKAREVKRIEAIEKETPIPSRAYVEHQNRTLLEAIGDISEPVRAAALHSAIARITAQPQLTGVRTEEAVSVVIEEIERAIRLAGPIGLTTVSIDTLAAAGQEEFGSSHLPYPANLALDIMDLRFAAFAPDAEPEANDAAQPDQA